LPHPADAAAAHVCCCVPCSPSPAYLQSFIGFDSLRKKAKGRRRRMKEPANKQKRIRRRRRKIRLFFSHSFAVSIPFFAFFL
jgi:hypothetical protein